MKNEVNLQIFNQFPTLETPRLLLREARLEDAIANFSLRTSPEVMRYMDTASPQTLADSEKKMRTIIGDFAQQKGINWIITLKGNETMVGYIGFWRLTLQHLRAEIGYALHQDHWGQGIMSEAMQAVLPWAFQSFQLHSIEANVNPENEASKKLLQRFGFQQEALFRENYFYKGQFLDSAIYGLVYTDYFPTKG